MKPTIEIPTPTEISKVKGVVKLLIIATMLAVVVDPKSVPQLIICFSFTSKSVTDGHENNHWNKSQFNKINESFHKINLNDSFDESFQEQYLDRHQSA